MPSQTKAKPSVDQPQMVTLASKVATTSRSTIAKPNKQIGVVVVAPSFIANDASNEPIVSNESQASKSSVDEDGNSEQSNTKPKSAKKIKSQIQRTLCKWLRRIERGQF